MKELSIEQKAKAYDEVVERLKDFRFEYRFSSFGDVIEEKFPEIKESKDEKIREELLNAFQESEDSLYMVLTPHRRESFIAWLKKQGEQSQYWKPSEEQLEALDYAYNSCPDTERGNYYEGVLETIIDDLHKLSEKQGEQKPDKVEPKFKVGKWYQCTKDFFGKGVTFDKNTAYYCAKEGCLQDEYGCHIAIVKDLYDNFKLWDITKDAKDGDVLIDKSNDRECPFIFKATKPSDIKTDILNPLAVLGYCGIGGAGFTTSSGWGDTANCIYYPATKKQRDALIKAMADAGYTFDFEKKELRKLKFRVGDEIKTVNEEPLTITKIDEKGYWSEDLFICGFDSEVIWDLIKQKKTDKVEPKFHEGEWVVQGHNILKIRYIGDEYYCYETVGGYVDSMLISEINSLYHKFTIQDVKEGDVLAIEPIKGYHSPFVAIYKKRNKEDFDSYCFIGFDGKFYKGESGHSTEGVHPATKEQRDTLEKAMTDAGYRWNPNEKKLEKIEQRQVIDYPDSLPKDNWELVHEFIETFGRIPKDEDELNVLVEYVLKRQKPTEWSKEDERMYRGLHNLIYSTPYCDSRKELSDWLESLRYKIGSQKYWKPSDEQMNTLEYYMHTLVCDEHKEILFGLYADLKKLTE
jgi:hypothetical protein